jgi:uncharacterized SAM-binding protein YcdF (DUF218 family)
MFDVGLYKPVLTALALPPVPFLLLILVGARLILPRRGLGYVVLLLGVAGIWLTSCHGMAVLLQDHVLKPPAPLLGLQQARLEAEGRAYAQQVAVARRSGRGSAVVPPAGIIVLGGGRQPLAPEYGMSDLSAYSAMRLRYGIWLSRQTGLPLGFSGGVGWVQKGEDSVLPEADVAARVAEQQFGQALRWVEGASADTKGNAGRSVAMLAEQGVREVVVVTDAFHMRRALREFVAAAQHEATAHPDRPFLKITPAVTGYWRQGERPLLDWLPSVEGMANVRLALRECLGLLIAS